MVRQGGARTYRGGIRWLRRWIPAYAGMMKCGLVGRSDMQTRNILRRRTRNNTKAELTTADVRPARPGTTGLACVPSSERMAEERKSRPPTQTMRSAGARVSQQVRRPVTDTNQGCLSGEGFADREQAPVWHAGRMVRMDVNVAPLTRTRRSPDCSGRKPITDLVVGVKVVRCPPAWDVTLRWNACLVIRRA